MLRGGRAGHSERPWGVRVLLLDFLRVLVIRESSPNTLSVQVSAVCGGVANVDFRARLGGYRASQGDLRASHEAPFVVTGGLVDVPGVPLRALGTF